MLDDDYQNMLENGSVASIQAVLKEIREKAYKAASVIKQLREQQQGLESRNKQLDETIKELQQRVDEKDALFKSLEEQAAAHGTVDVGHGVSYFSADEREALERQINELLARVNSHLG
jgi:chromosome segregation ATPase